MEGFLQESFIDLTSLEGRQLVRLRSTPSAALGTSRERPSDADLDRLLEIAGREGIDSVVAIGGNDTADSVWRLVKRADATETRLKAICVPKTIDNDLVGTDHCLGYPSAARFIALVTRDAAFDTMAMAGIYPIKIVEVMGRNAGWLAAAGSLAFDGDLPRPILCLPERPFASFDDLRVRVEGRIQRDGYAVLVAPETMRWADGGHVAGDTPEWTDQFGHPYYPSAGHALASRFTRELGVQARYDKPGTAARMAMHAASPVDLAEAEQAGVFAASRLAAGETGTMVSIHRLSDYPYRVNFGSTHVSRVASIERRIPDEMIAESGHDVTESFARYALPLIGEPFEPYEVLG